MTLQTVDGIVSSMDFCASQGQTSWESKMEKFLTLRHAYSSTNTVTGEKCYMVDEALYRDILLAVTARRQNEQLLAAPSERFEQHIEQIAGSNERVIQREKDAMEQMAQRMNSSYLQIQDEHKTRMKNVMADINALKESITVPADHCANSRETQRLKFEVTQYESVIPFYLARIEDSEDSNQRLLEEKRESTREIGHLRDRLNKAERLVFSMGTPESIRKRDTSGAQERKEEEATSSDDDGDVDGAEQGHSSSSSTSSEDEHIGTKTQQSAEQNKSAPIDLSVSPTEPAGSNKGTSFPLPATRPSFKEALVSSQDQSSQDVTMDGSSGTEAAPTLRRLLTLSSLGGRKDDAVNKRTRSSTAHSNDHEQPSNKRPHRTLKPLQNVMGAIMRKKRQYRKKLEGRPRT
jgi:hypothetical protein